MQPPIKPTAYKPTQSHSESCSFKPLLSYHFSLLLPLSQLGKKPKTQLLNSPLLCNRPEFHITVEL